MHVRVSRFFLFHNVFLGKILAAQQDVAWDLCLTQTRLSGYLHVKEVDEPQDLAIFSDSQEQIGMLLVWNFRKFSFVWLELTEESALFNVSLIDDDYWYS